MNAEERAVLGRFLDDLASARSATKDAEADGLIRQALAANPDGAYLLVQHAIVADQSLHAAQQRIAALEQQQQQAQPQASSFLPQAGGGAGAWGARPAAAYAPPPADERPGIFSGGGGLGSFLRSAGTTAAGVAGGEMLFSGLSDLFGHHGGGGMFGGGDSFTGRPEEITINNYGDDGDRGDPGDYNDGSYDDDN